MVFCDSIVQNIWKCGLASYMWCQHSRKNNPTSVEIFSWKLSVNGNWGMHSKRNQTFRLQQGKPWRNVLTYCLMMSSDIKSCWWIYSIYERSYDDNLNCIWFKNWSKLEYYESDFGFGTPVWTSIVNISIKNLIILRNTEENYGIEAWLHLHENDMPYFEQVEEVKKLITLFWKIIVYESQMKPIICQSQIKCYVSLFQLHLESWTRKILFVNYMLFLFDCVAPILMIIRFWREFYVIFFRRGLFYIVNNIRMSSRGSLFINNILCVFKIGIFKFRYQFYYYYYC